MWRGLISVLTLAAGLGGLTSDAGAVQTCLRMSAVCHGPQLVPTLGGIVGPQELPRSKYAPVAASVFGKFNTSDGTHPSALRQVEFDIDKDVRINVKGFPACRPKLLQELGTNAAKDACRSAFLGEGIARASIVDSEYTSTLLSTRLLVFNAGENSHGVTLLIHGSVPAPNPTPLMARIMIRREGVEYHATATIPVIAGGMGSLLNFKFKLGKTYSYKGKKYGYFEAKCPDGVFKANVKKILFKNEAKIPGVAPQTVLKGGLAVPCTPKG